MPSTKLKGIPDGTRLATSYLENTLKKKMAQLSLYMRLSLEQELDSAKVRLNGDNKSMYAMTPRRRPNSNSNEGCSGVCILQLQLGDTSASCNLTPA
jgi:hypothetical protein